jgi:hypothetical protein
MKLILIIVALGAAVWYGMTKAKDNAVIRQAAEAPEKYTKALQNDAARAQAAVDKANAAVKAEEHEVQKTVDGQ